jgi:acyl-coenzyme A synthetase/AMP-(fatty) acid ligase
VLTELDGVPEVALVGQPDDVLGERVVAFVNAAPGHINETQVREWCRKRMADYKVPDRVVIADVPLPRNANGKIQKAELRAMAAQLPGRTQRHQVTT